MKEIFRKKLRKPNYSRKQTKKELDIVHVFKTQLSPHLKQLKLGTRIKPPTPNTCISEPKEQFCVWLRHRACLYIFIIISFFMLSAPWLFKHVMLFLFLLIGILFFDPFNWIT